MKPSEYRVKFLEKKYDVLAINFEKKFTVIEIKKGEKMGVPFGVSVPFRWVGIFDRFDVPVYEGDDVKFYHSDIDKWYFGKIEFGDGSFFINSQGSSFYRLTDYEIVVK